MVTIMDTLQTPMDAALPQNILETLESTTGLPRTLADAFMASLRLSFVTGAALPGIAAVLSAMRGGLYVHEIHGNGKAVEVKAVVPGERK
jgi:hypothetical protein